MSAEASRLLDEIDIPADLRRLEAGALPRLADEVRTELIDAVSQTGGHLGAGLGVVELTVALHFVFDTPRDRLIWDVSHQAYPHKILTGRRARMRGIRQQGGLSGFTRRVESEYDPFGAAHSSTSISAGLGMAVARDLKRGAGHVVAVIGDGALSAGMAFEAMNNAGAHGRRLIVVLNDNDMSIAPAVGALSAYLPRLRADRRDAAKPAERTVFEQLGLRYVGPIDGHDLAALVPALVAARDSSDGPILIHVKTEKGKGYAPAEANGEKLHGVVTFDVATGAQKKGQPRAPSYTRVFADALIAEARTDERIVGITAAMPSGTGIDLFARSFPDRAFDVGIAEQHAVTFAAGLAAEGYKPFCAIYSTFLQRAFDQVVHDVALQNLPVRFAIDRAGLVGADGATHAGSFDIGYLGQLPNFVVMAAADEAELVHMVATAAGYDRGPIAFRYPRGEGVGVDLPAKGEPLEIGKGRILRRGEGVALLSLGTRLAECLKAADRLAALGLAPTVADARFAKPLDHALIERLARRHQLVVTVEEGAIGGFGGHVMHHLAEAGLLDGGLRVRSMVLPDRFIDHGDCGEMYAAAGLDAAAIVDKVLSALPRMRAPRRGARPFGHALAPVEFAQGL